MPDARLRLAATGLDLDRPPFSVLWPEPLSDGRFEPREASFRPATDDHWASLRLVVPVPHVYDGAEVVVKEWVNDWWPPPCPDLPLRDRGTLRWVPGCADVPGTEATWWVAGLDHHGTPGLATHRHGTNVEVRLPDGMDAMGPDTAELLSRLALVARGPVSWFQRAFHPHRDIPERGWGEGIMTGLDWSPWASAPEHPECPAPDLFAPDRLPDGWMVDATGARENPRHDHYERQWVVVQRKTGNPLMWARAVPLTSRARHPLVVRADSRYRLDWDETPIGWAGSLHPRHGHHVVLLERGDLRIEVWIGLAAGLDRDRAALVADKAFL